MRHRPLLAWTLAFLAGVGAWGEWHVPLWAAGGAALGGALALLGGGRWPALVAASLLLTGWGAGALRLASFQSVPVDDISHWAGASAQVMGTVGSEPDTREGRAHFVLQAAQITARRQTQTASGAVWVTLPLAQGSSVPDYGDRVALDGRLETPRPATNPGGFSWQEYLSRRGVYCQLNVRRPQGAQVQGPTRANLFLRLAWQGRRRTLRAIDASLPSVQSAALAGILLGQRTALPSDLLDDFVRTGTVHILATAGLHVGILAWWLLFLCERLTLPRKLSAVLIIGTLWLYAMACGGRPSVTRAVVMATVYFLAIVFEREPDAPTALAVAALFVLLAQPTALWDAGFQLSFLTVLTLALALPVWEAFWRPRLERWVSSVRLRRAAGRALELVGLTLFAQIGAAPIVASAYNQVSLAGVWANLLVVPLLFALVPLGLAGALVWQIGHAAGVALLHAAGWGLVSLIGIVRAFGEAPWTARAVAPPAPIWIVAYYAVIYGGLYALSRRFAAPSATCASDCAPEFDAVAAVSPSSALAP